MKAPGDDDSSQSRGAEERLRQHLRARLPADEVEEALRRLRPEAAVEPAEDVPLADSSGNELAEGDDDISRARDKTD